MKFGLIWLAWTAVLFACMAIFGYTKKLVGRKPKWGWGIRATVVVAVLAFAVLMTITKKEEKVTINSNSAPSLSQQPTTPAPTGSTEPAAQKKETKVKSPKPSVPSVSSSGDRSPATGSISQGAGSALSFNQQGGITAGTVNIAPPNRHLTAEQKTAIVFALQGKPCAIASMGALSNVEDAQNYAFEILDAFKAAGCTVPGTVRLMMTEGKTWTGITVRYHSDTEHVSGDKVYVSPSSPEGLIVGALDSARLGNVMVGTGPNMTKDTVDVEVGGRTP